MKIAKIVLLAVLSCHSMLMAQPEASDALPYSPAATLQNNVNQDLGTELQKFGKFLSDATLLLASVDAENANTDLSTPSEEARSQVKKILENGVLGHLGLATRCWTIDHLKNQWPESNPPILDKLEKFSKDCLALIEEPSGSRISVATLSELSATAFALYSVGVMTKARPDLFRQVSVLEDDDDVSLSTKAFQIGLLADLYWMVSYRAGYRDYMKEIENDLKKHSLTGDARRLWPTLDSFLKDHKDAYRHMVIDYANELGTQLIYRAEKRSP
jgi:hypothetical protein